MRRFTLLFTWVVMALALCAQPVIAVPFSESLAAGDGLFNAIEAQDGIGNVSLSGTSMFLGGNEPVTVFMKIDIGVFATSATISTSGDWMQSNPIGAGAGGTLSVGSGLVDAGDPSLGLVNETLLINHVGAGDWTDLAVAP